MCRYGKGNIFNIIQVTSRDNVATQHAIHTITLQYQINGKLENGLKYQSSVQNFDQRCFSPMIGNSLVTFYTFSQSRVHRTSLWKPMHHVIVDILRSINWLLLWFVRRKICQSSTISDLSAMSVLGATRVLYQVKCYGNNAKPAAKQKE